MGAIDAAIHRHERLVGAAAEAVDHARHQLLAGAGLALDDDRRVGGRRAQNLLINLDHAPAKLPIISLSGSSSSSASSSSSSREASARSTASIIMSRSNGLAM